VLRLVWNRRHITTNSTKGHQRPLTADGRVHNECRDLEVVIVGAAVEDASLAYHWVRRKPTSPQSPPSPSGASLPHLILNRFLRPGAAAGEQWHWGGSQFIFEHVATHDWRITRRQGGTAPRVARARPACASAWGSETPSVRKCASSRSIRDALKQHQDAGGGVRSRHCCFCCVSHFAIVPVTARLASRSLARRLC
jgi:hypothetical protein